MAPEDAIALVAYISLAVSSVTVGLRVLVRCRWLEGGLRLDDWLMIVALILYLGFCAAIIAVTITERQNPVLTEQTADLILLLIAIGESVFMVTSIAFKISLAIFFRRFLLERNQRRLIWGVTGVYCIFSVLGFFLGLFECGAPTHLAWKRVNGHCIPTPWWNGLLYVHGSVSAFSDWVFALLPILILWKSSMPAKKKLGVTFLMLFAVCGSLCAILRTIYVGSLQFDARYYNVHHQPNYYKATALVINMATLELGLGITAASAACLMPLFRRVAALFRHGVFSRSGWQHFQKRQKQSEWTGQNDRTPDRTSTLNSRHPKSLERGDMDSKTLGILPNVDSLTDEDISTDSHDATTP